MDIDQEVLRSKCLCLIIRQFLLSQESKSNRGYILAHVGKKLLNFPHEFFIPLAICKLDAFNVVINHLHLVDLADVLYQVAVSLPLALDVGMELGDIDGEIERDDELFVPRVEIVPHEGGISLSSFYQFFIGDLKRLRIFVGS